MHPPDREDRPLSEGGLVPGAEFTPGYALLSTAARNILDGTHLPEILQLICQEVCHVLGADRSMIVRMSEGDPPGREVLHSHRVPEEFIDAVNSIKAPSSLMSTVFQTGRIEVVSELRGNPLVVFPELQKRIGHQTICLMPLIVGGKPFGSLFLYHLAAREYTPGDRQLAEALADLASIAIEKARLVADTRKHSSHLEIAGNISRAIGSTLEPGELFETIAREIRRAVPCVRCVIAGVDPDTKRTHIWHQSSDIPVRPSTEAESAALGGWINENVYETLSPVHIRSEAYKTIKWANRFSEGRIESYLAVPILRDNRCIAHLAVNHTRPDAFTDEHKNLMAAVAGHLGSAIRNASLFQESKERGRRLETLVEVTRRITGGLTLEDVLFGIAEDAAKVFDGEAGFRILEGDYLRLAASTSGAAKIMGEERLRVGESISGRVAESGEPIITADSASDSRQLPAHRSAVAPDETGALMCVPVKREGGILGTLAICRERGHLFDEEALRLATSFADQISIAIENARLHEDVQTRAARLEIAGKIAKAVGSELEPEELFRTITKEIRGHVPCDRIVISSMSVNGDHYRNVSVESDVGFFEEMKEKVKRRLWVHNEVYKTKRLRNFPDIRELELSWLGTRVDAGLRSWIVVPILRDETCVSHLSLLSRKVGAFDEDCEELLTAIAGHLGAAIHNSDLYRDAGERAARLEITGKIANAVASKLEPDELFRTITKEIYGAIRCDRVVLASLNPDGFRYRNASVEPNEGFDVSDDTRIQRRKWVHEEIYQGKRLHNIPDLQDLEYPWIKPWTDAGQRSWLVAPVLQDGSCVAHISLVSKEVAAFDSNCEALLTSVTGQIGAAIQNANLYRDAGERAARLEITGAISKAVGSEIEPEELFKTIVREIRRVVPCSRCLIGCYDREEGQNRAFYQETDIELPPLRKFEDYADWWFGEVYEHRRPAIVSDMRDLPYRRAREVAEVGIRSQVLIPVLQGSECIAHLSLMSDQVDGFDQDQVGLLTEVAGHLGAAIQNASLYRTAEKRAERLSITNEITKALGSTLEPKELFRKIVSEIRRLVPSERCVIATMDLVASNHQVHHFESDVEVKSLIEAGGPAPGGPIFTAYESKQPSYIPDYREGPAFREVERFKNSVLRSGLTIPVIQDDVCIAHIGIQSVQVDAYSREDIELLSSIAGQLAVVIRNASLFHESGERGRRLGALVEVAKRLTSGLDLNEILSAIAAEAGAVFEGEADFRIREGDELVLMGSTPGLRKFPFKERIRIGESLSGIVAEKGEPLLAENIHNDERVIAIHREALDPDMFGASVFVPLSRDSRVLGVLAIHRPPGFGFAEGDLRIAASLADQAATAIHNARLFEALQRRTDELVRARDGAEAASRAKTEFLANMSHELRSPLNAITGFSDILLMQSQDEITRQLVPKMRDAGKYLTRLIEDLLDFDRLESGDIRLDSGEADINGIIQEAVEVRRSQLPSGYEIACSFDPECGLVICDSARVIQVLMNLIDNAVKFSPDGGHIGVRTERHPGEVHVSVRDNGIGIDPEEIGQIFDRFSQVESGYKRSSGGLGIGLSFVRELLELQGGRIWVDSERGSGSAFTFALPASGAAAPVPEEISDQTASPGESDELNEGKEPWRGRKFLVVDDVEHQHEFMRLFLKGAAAVESAYDGGEGVAAARLLSPDLILMDLRMPGYNGFTAIETLKSDPATREIPILVMTAPVMTEDQERCRELGADGFVMKPVDLEKFSREVERVLSK
jgi:GAF domain-containing protein/CheY-like chemotaxis protein